MSPQHLQLVINRLDYTLNKNTFKVDISFQVLNDYGLGLGGEKSTYYKHICSGPSSPEVQKTQGTDIHYIFASVQRRMDIIVRAMSGTRSRTSSPPATSRSAPPSPRRSRHGSSFLICKLQSTDNIWTIQCNDINTQGPMLCAQWNTL